MTKEFPKLLSVRQIKIPSEQLSALHQWLKQSSGSVLRRMLRHRVQEAQIEAAEMAHRALKYPQFAEDAASALERVTRYQTALDVLREFSDPKTDYYNIQLNTEE